MTASWCAISGCCDYKLYWRGLTANAAAYTHFRDRYSDMARKLGFEGHIAWAEALP